ncbi:zinc/manganese transport system substrate-binding protein [Brevibacterium sp. 239c]|uniref:metal ABC transporter solute-binding protein, Zn/Mn family n=1 Tax=Brevibacterium sp. 239c TaxID=1965356 RepID=UPI000C44458B|nr:zinc ABC transporter substrate-binding protein [Brevibacterium sp. 239c]SMX77696.1 zinc/manganese transport system substrate-binding protein [Brevibacterium sp. 239c]
MRSSLLGIMSGAIALSTVAALSGCGGQASGSTELSVVASTNVYADIVSQVAGDFAKVSAVIDDPNQDPHSYEATTHDRLMLSKSDLVVQNGGGYDSFMTTMLEASDVEVDTIDTVSISGLPGSEGVGNESHEHGDEEASGGGHVHDHGEEEGHDHGDEGHDHAHGEFNEHLWYSVPTMTKLVNEVATHLGEADPEHKDDFAANADDYTKTLEKLQSQIDDARDQHEGDEVATTEPVPLWLFADMGLKNITSDEFLEAVEEGNDVPPLVLKKAEEQISSGDALLLGYNTQAAGPQAEQLKSTAEESDVPVVDLGETMPAGAHYATWMGDYITEISTALEGHEH